jgi:hypothetical protein
MGCQCPRQGENQYVEANKQWACKRAESLLHRFCLCPHSVCAWNEMRKLSGLCLESPSRTQVRPGELQSWLLDWLGSLSKREAATGIMLIYQLWLARKRGT